jgi:hypothetical protein
LLPLPILIKSLYPCHSTGGHGLTNLNLHEVSLFLSNGQLLDLGVGQNSNGAAVLLELLQLCLNLFLPICVLLGIFGEALLLGLGPVLVEPF